MGRISTFGQHLYEGRVSFDFVGRRKLWYSISAAIVVLAALAFAHSVTLGLIAERVGTDTASMRMLGDVIQRLALIEADIMASHLSASDAEAARIARREGLVDVDGVDRRGPRMIVRGSDRRGDDITVVLDSRSGDVLDVRR